MTPNGPAATVSRAMPENAFKRPKIEPRIAWISRIRNPIGNDGLRLMSQPIVDPHTRDVAAHERLPTREQ